MIMCTVPLAACCRPRLPTSAGFLMRLAESPFSPRKKHACDDLCPWADADVIRSACAVQIPLRSIYTAVRSYSKAQMTIVCQ